VLACDRWPSFGKLQKLAKLGLDTDLAENLKPGFDMVVDCSGSTEGLDLALKLVRPRGTIVLKSTAKGSGVLNLASAVVDEISIIGSRCGRFAPALAALARGKIDPRATNLSDAATKRRGASSLAGRATIDFQSAA